MTMRQSPLSTWFWFIFKRIPAPADTRLCVQDDYGYLHLVDVNKTRVSLGGGA